MADAAVNTVPRRARRGESLRGAGYLLAAADSSKHYKDQAHEICTGTNDQERIKFAIDNIGGKIVLLPGTYSVARPTGQVYCLLIEITSDLDLVGMPGAVLKLADGQFNGESGTIIRVNAAVGFQDHLNLRGFTLDGNVANNPGVANNTTGSVVGITTQSINDCFFGDGLTIRNVHGTGFWGRGGNNDRNVFSRLTIHDCGEGLVLSGFDSCRINQLLIHDLTFSDGFEPVNCSDLVMTNSIIRNTGSQCVDIFGNQPGEIARAHRYSNCVFGPINASAGGGGPAIIFDIGGNSQGLFEDIELDNCHFDMGNAEIGLLIGDSDALAVATGTVRSIVARITVNGAGSLTDSVGIQVSDTAETVEVDARVHDCGADGILVNAEVDDGGDEDVNPSGVTVKGRYYNNNQDGNGGAGIKVGAKTGRVDILGAECFDDQDTPTQDYGIDVSAGVDDLLVRGCNLHGNQVDGIRYGPGARNEFAENRGQVFDNVDDTTDSHTGDTIFTTLKSRTIPGRLLETGRLIEIEAWGRRTGGATSYDLRFLYGIVSEGEITHNGDEWWLKATLQHLGASSQRGYILSTRKGNIDIETLTSAVDDTVDLTLALQVRLGAVGDTVFCDQIHYRLRS